LLLGHPPRRLRLRETLVFGYGLGAALSRRSFAQPTLLHKEKLRMDELYSITLGENLIQGIHALPAEELDLILKVNEAGKKLPEPQRIFRLLRNSKGRVMAQMLITVGDNSHRIEIEKRVDGIGVQGVLELLLALLEEECSTTNRQMTHRS